MTPSPTDEERQELVAGGYAFESIMVPESMGTVTNDINVHGDHTGLYLDPSYAVKAYLFLDGSFETFSVPEATEVFPHGIHANGDVVGDYATSNGVYRAFVREKDGKVTTFEYPDASNTFVTDIANGHLLGIYDDEAGNRFSFRRSGGGDFEAIAFDDDFSTSLQTLLNGSSANGKYAGGVVSAPCGSHSCESSSSIVFDGSQWQQLPTPSYMFNNTAYGIDHHGLVVGQYFDAEGNGPFGDTYDAGEFETFDFPGSTITGPVSLSPDGVIVGFYDDESGTRRGFIAKPE